MMIVSLHLPKTAGSSLARTLADHFGDAMLRDYGDLPINTPPRQRNLHALRASIDNADRDFSRIRCIHGHFLPLKYLAASMTTEVTFVTWLRDPVERLASHYWFWKKTYDPSTAPALQRRVVEEEWSLERFCLGDELRNTYRQFTWGFPLEMFDFVGIVEHYASDFAHFTKTFLGGELTPHTENVGDKRTVHDRHIKDPNFRQAIEEFHQLDVRLYQRALAIRKATRGSSE